MKDIPYCVGLEKDKAEMLLMSNGYDFSYIYYEGYKMLEGADSLCVVRQKQIGEGTDTLKVELVLCSFKRNA